MRVPWIGFDFLVISGEMMLVPQIGQRLAFSLNRVPQVGQSLVGFVSGLIDFLMSGRNYTIPSRRVLLALRNPESMCYAGLDGSPWRLSAFPLLCQTLSVL
ncbi:MAG: hypothetical protein JXR32_03205 [Anaerolineaceae bacterium]|nr:hypothetical protein [Anaerolineaceae bacterium]